ICLLICFPHIMMIEQILLNPTSGYPLSLRPNPPPVLSVLWLNDCIYAVRSSKSLTVIPAPADSAREGRELKERSYLPSPVSDSSGSSLRSPMYRPLPA
ncbi:MAG: hypothetical protein K8S24_08705, partial [Candidatus Aegiribacteria sp.]|nr:hypothetical protein [Candidatus Aegiribacteria sp.]